MESVYESDAGLAKGDDVDVMLRRFVGPHGASLIRLASSTTALMSSGPFKRATSL